MWHLVTAMGFGLIGIYGCMVIAMTVWSARRKIIFALRGKPMTMAPVHSFHHRGRRRVLSQGLHIQTRNARKHAA